MGMVVWDSEMIAAELIAPERWLREGGHAWNFISTSGLVLKWHMQGSPLARVSSGGPFSA